MTTKIFHVIENDAVWQATSPLLVVDRMPQQHHYLAQLD